MFTRILLNVSFCLVCALTFGQAYKPVMILRDHNTEHLSEYYTYWLQPFEAPEKVQVADSMYQQGAFKHWKWHKSLSLGDARKRLWVRMVVTNESDINTRFVWSIHDFLDTATLYMSTDSGFSK